MHPHPRLRWLLPALVASLGLAGPAAALPAGDVNGDGTADAGDAAYLARILAGELAPPAPGSPAFLAADLAPIVNGIPEPDGALDGGDLVVLMRALAGQVDLHVPKLDPPSANPTGDNPFTITGIGRPGDTIRVFVDGVEQLDTRTVQADGTFQHEVVALNDGTNSITVRAQSGTATSGPSNAISVDYNGTHVHNLTSGAIISNTQVWTPDTGGPYVINSLLRIDSGGTLILQPGVELQMTGNANVLVNPGGTLRLLGDAGNEVTVRGPAGSTTRGVWLGIDVGTAAGAPATLVLRHAAVLYAADAVDVRSNSTLDVSDTRLAEFSSHGIHVQGAAAAAIDGVSLDNSAGGLACTFCPTGILIDANPGPVTITNSLVETVYTGMDIGGGAPEISATTVQNGHRGVFIHLDAAPHIYGASKIVSNVEGVYVLGSGASPNPSPVINDSTIALNTAFNYEAEANSFYQPASTVLDASGNYWGLPLATQIISTITDATDQPNSPVVDFVPFLDREGGTPVPGNFIVGDLASGTTLVPGIPYEVVGQINVPAGASLTVQAGAVLRFQPKTRLHVEGLLDVAASPFYRALFTSAQAVPASGDWDGISLTATATGSVIDGALVRFAHVGIHVVDAGVAIRDCVIENWGRSGGSPSPPAAIYLENASGIVSNNLIRRDPQYPKPVSSMPGIWVKDGAPIIQDNEVHDAANGIVIEGTDSQNKAAPTLTGNLISGNDQYGVSIKANAAPVLSDKNVITGNGTAGIEVIGGSVVATDPAPLIVGNDIYGNGGATEKNLELSGFGDPANTLVAATGNWWGSSQLDQVVATIVDRADGGPYSSAPSAQIGPWLDNSTLQNGSEVPGQFLVGTLAPATSLDPGVDYTATGDLRLAAGETLTIVPGTRLHFAPGARFLVEGVLAVQGNDIDRPLFDSAVPGDWWEGIEIVGSSVGSSIDFADIVYAHRGVWVTDTDVDITNSNLIDFGDPSGAGGVGVGAGLRLENAGGTIAGNVLTRAAAPTSGLDGIRLIGSDAVVDANEVARARDGIRIESSTAQLTGNDVHDNSQYGVFIGASSSVQITTGNVIQSNLVIGVMVAGDSIEAHNPLVVVNGNDLLQNGPTDLKVTGFGNPSAYPVDATLNYWNTEDPGVIATRIIDPTGTCTGCPVVDFDPALDANHQPLSGGGALYGPLPNPLTPGTYRAVGDVTVAAGTLQAGTTIEFDPGTKLIVNGTLAVQGTSFGSVVLKLTPGAPAGSKWAGVQIVGPGHDTTLSYVDIYDADVGVYVQDEVATTSIVHNRFYDCKTAAIHLVNSPILVEDNWIYYSGGTAASGGATGIWVAYSDASATLRANHVRDMFYGVYLDWSASPTLEANDIHDNKTGVDVARFGDAPDISGGNSIHDNWWGLVVSVSTASTGQPTITGNSIYNNADPVFLTPQNLSAVSGAGETPEVDARGNYWGTIDPAAIAAGVHDLTDQPSNVLGAVVGLTPFLNDMMQPQPGNYLSGYVEDASTPLAADTTYDALGTLVVPPATTWTVPAGVTLRMFDGAQLRATGMLDVNGVTGDEVLLTTAVAPAAPGSWKGIYIGSPSSGSAIDHATVEYAAAGVSAVGASVDITASSITNFSQSGVFMNQAGGTITDTTIDNLNGTGTGVDLSYSSPTLGGTTPGTAIRNVYTGISVGPGSNPTLQANTEISDTTFGVKILGNAGAPSLPAPQPVIHDTRFVNNTTNVWVGHLFEVGSSQIFDFRNNYWGADTVPEIRAKIVYEDDSPPVPVDFSDFLDAQGAMVTGTYLTNLLTGVSQGGVYTHKLGDPDFQVDYFLGGAADVTVSFYREGGDPVLDQVWSQTTSRGPGAQQVTWDGRDTNLNLVPEGLYTYRLTASDTFGNQGFYDPTTSTSLVVQRTVQITPGPQDFRPSENESLQFTVDVTGTPVRLRLQAAQVGEAPFYVFTDQLFLPGSHVYRWNGRRPDGTIVDDTVSLFVDLQRDGPVNSVLIDGLAPDVSGSGGPGIEVKADPYLVYHSYEQEAQIVYQLDQDAHVWVWLLPPGITDPGDPSAIPIVSDDPQMAKDPMPPNLPINHSFTWAGHDATDTNRIRTDQEGTFSFAIRARSDQTNVESTYLGALQVRR